MGVEPHKWSRSYWACSRKSECGMKTSFLVLLLSAIPAAVQAQFTFTTNNGAITITKYTGTGGAVTIPDTTNGYPVTDIGDDAFEYSGLTAVTIPGSVTNIGDSAFYSCLSLSNTAIPDSVTQIGASAFYQCISLTDVTIPESVTALGTWRLLTATI